MIDKLLAYVAPHLCYGCAKTGSILCDSCAYNIIEEPLSRCIWCFRSVMDNDICRLCSKRLGVRAAWAIGERTGVLKALLNNYKYESAREAARVLSKLVAERLAYLPADTVVTHVPTAPAHIRQRGFDHAALIARLLADRRKYHFSPLFTRHLNLSQHTLSRAERLAQASRAFRLKPATVPRSVLLVDDIMTTGATLEACVRLLNQADVEEIYVAIVARQLPEGEP